MLPIQTKDQWWKWLNHTHCHICVTKAYRKYWVITVDKKSIFLPWVHLFFITESRGTILARPRPAMTVARLSKLCFKGYLPCHILAFIKITAGSAIYLHISKWGPDNSMMKQFPQLPTNTKLHYVEKTAEYRRTLISFFLYTELPFGVDSN